MSNSPRSEPLHGAHSNWVDGRAVPSERGDTYEARLESTRAVLGRWPRSGEHDLSAALAACERAERLWARTTRAARVRELERACERLGTGSAALAEAARAFGATPAEVDEWADDALDAAERVFAPRDAPAACPGPGSEGAHVLALDWSEVLAAPFEFVVRALLAGRALVLVADPRADAAADVLAHACAELPAGLLNVLHDDGRTVLRAAFADVRVARLHLPSAAEVNPELEERERATGPAALLRIERGFGAGVEITRPRKLAVRALANASFVAREQADVEAQAEEVVERAFGRVRALSGFAPGRVGRAIVPVRQFSRFTAALLDVLENDPDALDPLEIARAPALPLVERAFRLGHDEGATAIFTGSADDRLPFPLVFTNVEERMRLATATRPAPVLCLLRAYDAVHANSLAQVTGG